MEVFKQKNKIGTMMGEKIIDHKSIIGACRQGEA